MSKLAPVSWQAPEAPGLVGDYAVNDRLATARLIPTPFTGPEDVVVDETGTIYTGTEDGSILRVTTGARSPLSPGSEAARSASSSTATT